MAGPVDIEIRRVYDARPTPGRTRVLVDRVWPRGLRREALALDLWLRELGPSDELRRWFGHRPDRWDEFQRRYRAELEQPRQVELLGQLARLARDGPLTLLYGARDEQRNQAVVLRAVLQERLGRDQR
jgi:uncharacterized protein YeaO (DUF488 family)